MMNRMPERRKARRIWAMAQAVAMLVAIICVAVATDRLHDQTESDLRIISVQTCNSVNEGRTATNQQAKLMHRLLTTLSARVKQVVKDGTPEEQREAAKYAGIYGTLADSYREIELADCRYPPVRGSD